MEQYCDVLFMDYHHRESLLMENVIPSVPKWITYEEVRVVTCKLFDIEPVRNYNVGEGVNTCYV